MKTAIIIPYRDRSEHLKMILPWLSGYLAHVDHKIYVIEQDNSFKHFNKGLMHNAGFEIAREDAAYDRYIFHDVDMLPLTIDYLHPGKVVHMAAELQQYDYFRPFATFFGGILGFDQESYEAVNGFSNCFWGWGIEDDDIWFRCKHVLGPDQVTFLQKGKAYCFDHERDMEVHRQANDRWHNYSTNEYELDGLNSSEYTITEIDYPSSFFSAEHYKIDFDVMQYFDDRFYDRTVFDEYRQN